MEKIKDYYSLLLIVALIFVTACQPSSDQDKVDLEDIPTSTPKQLISFDHVDDFYFSHLGYSSMVLANGEILISDRDNTAIIVIDAEGNLKKKIREGRGPGEILDAYMFTSDIEGNVYTYDQKNNKVIYFDSHVELVSEIKPKPNRETSIVKVYPMANENFLFELTSFAYLEQENKDREKIFVQYDPETEAYGNELFLKDQPYARTYRDGKLVGASAVPFADIQLVVYYPDHQSLLIFDTRTNIIAEIDANFDTLNTIRVNLPKEKLSTSERNEIKSSYRNEKWKTVEPFLPEYKATADKMIFHNENIWLKSNLWSDYQKWLVINMDGQIEQLVNLPKESMLMHISKQHLGVRLDDVTFALFEPVN
ncbi:MAG: 6-bladed beta-propeller [Balneolaceae bacterium]